jgi:hypothetical protein
MLETAEYSYVLFEDLDAECFVLVFKDNEYNIQAKSLGEAEQKAEKLIKGLVV